MAHSRTRTFPKNPMLWSYASTHFPILISIILKHRQLWRFAGIMSGTIGLLCYALSSSFECLYGKWNLLKLILYCVVSLIISCIMIFPEKLQSSWIFWLKSHVVFLVLILTSLYSVFYDKSINGKPDVYSVVSNGAFALMSLSLSRQIQLGFESVLCNFFLGCFIVQLMKINLILTSVVAVFYFSLISLRSCMDSKVKSGSVCDDDQVNIEAGTINEGSSVRLASKEMVDNGTTNGASFDNLESMEMIPVHKVAKAANKKLNQSENSIARPLQLPFSDNLLSGSCRIIQNHTQNSEARALQLRFMNKLPSTLFTQSKLVSEDSAPIQIALVDANSQDSIVGNGPESSATIEICVLRGEFGSNKFSDDWTVDEFNANTLIPRAGAGSMLSGERFITLKNGVGYIDRIMFTDNSGWTRSLHFRLGAKVVRPNFHAVNIKEAVSDPFMVKDKPGDAFQKHDSPALNDPVWRLTKIAKGGKIHKHLSSHGIDTVKDLSHLHTVNPPSFEEIFAIIPMKLRETIMENAKACKGLVVESSPEQDVRKPSQLNSERTTQGFMNLFAGLKGFSQSNGSDQNLRLSRDFDEGDIQLLIEKFNILNFKDKLP